MKVTCISICISHNIRYSIIAYNVCVSAPKASIIMNDKFITSVRMRNMTKQNLSQISANSSQFRSKYIASMRFPASLCSASFLSSDYTFVTSTPELINVVVLKHVIFVTTRVVAMIQEFCFGLPSLLNMISINTVSQTVKPDSTRTSPR